MQKIIKKNNICSSKWLLAISLMFTVHIFINAVFADTFPPQTKAFNCQTFPATEPTSLCYIQVDNSYPHWYLISEAHTLLVEINKTEPHISGFSIAPSGNFVAVESVAEGHPMVQVYDTHLLLTRNHVEFLQGWGTPPGWINISAWNGDELTIETNIPRHKMNDRNTEYPEHVIYQFVWSVDHPELKLLETDSVNKPIK